MAVYKYRPLDLARPSIRLLELPKGSFGEDIKCRLIDAWLEDGIPYDALSYTWGSTQKLATIRVDEDILDVTENAHDALQRLRSEDEPRYLWIDAICINQDNPEERGHQVQHMNLIYQKAERVFVWLGQGTEKTDLVMDAMKQIQHILIRKKHDWKQREQLWIDNCMVESRGGMKILLSRPWFKRIWIIQEIANARVATILCGSRSISASTFAQFPSFLGLEVNPHCQAVLDIMPGVSRQKSWWSEKHDLHTLLIKFRNSKATDERDMVYALLGISSDLNRGRVLLPEYGKPLAQVIQGTVSFLLSHLRLNDSIYNFLDWTLLKFLWSLESLSGAVLITASKDGHETVVKLLLATGQVDVDAKDEGGLTPLFWALNSRHYEIAKLLIETGQADISAKDNEGQTPLLLALHSRHYEIAKLVIETGQVDVKAKDEGGRTQLFWALNSRNYELAKLLIETGQVDIDSKDNEGQTLLSWAAYMGEEEAVNLLIETGQANLDLKDREGRTPLSRAASNRCNEIPDTVSKFARPLGVQKNNEAGNTERLNRGRINIVMLLIKTGQVDLNSKDNNGRTALSWASSTGCSRVLMLLLQTGQVDINSRDKEDRTPLWWAIHEGHETEAMLLREADQANDYFSSKYWKDLILGRKFGTAT